MQSSLATFRNNTVNYQCPGMLWQPNVTTAQLQQPIREKLYEKLTFLFETINSIFYKYTIEMYMLCVLWCLCLEINATYQMETLIVI